jgi:branched-chain amino acid transport system substrate-binding protein
MDAAAQDMGAQLAKLKASDADTLIVTGAVDQLTLVFRQAAALGLKRKIITTGGSQNPDQIAEQAGAGATGTMHLVFFAPWAPEATPNPDLVRAFIQEYKSRGYSAGGLAQSFRGYDGIRAIAGAIELAGKAEPEAIRAAMWKIHVDGVNGKITFQKSGPEGKESGQSVPEVYLVKIDGGKVVMPQL